METLETNGSYKLFRGHPEEEHRPPLLPLPKLCICHVTYAGQSAVHPDSIKGLNVLFKEFVLKTQ